MTEHIDNAPTDHGHGVSKTAAGRSFDTTAFRYVLGHYPTGVSAITTIDADRRPTGLAVGTFTSVSLEPPLVAFLPDKTSSTFPKIRDAGRFCVNVLGADQEAVCRSLAAKGTDKFRGLSWTPAPITGMPVLDGAVAWIDCEISSVTEVGDHWFVVGRVLALDVHQNDAPLLFFQGGYGHFSQPSRSAAAESDLVTQLRQVDELRPAMRRLAEELEVEVLAVSLVADEMVIVGSAGHPRDRPVPTRLGQRIPLVPPLGAAFVAWSDDPEIERWLGRAPALSPARRDRLMRSLETVRRRGWSLAIDDRRIRHLEAAVFRTPDEPDRDQTDAVTAVLGEVIDAYEPATLPEDVQLRPNNIIAPVFGDDGSVTTLLALYGLPPRMTAAEITAFADRLVRAAGGPGPRSSDQADSGSGV